MKISVNKFRYIFIPFLATTLTFTAAYTFLNWLFVIKLDWLNIDQNIINVMAPLLLPWIPQYIFFKPRTYFFDVHIKKGHHLLYLGMSGFITIVATMLAQDYIGAATGKMTTVKHVSDLSDVPKTRYCEISDFFINKNHLGTHQTATLSGPHGETMTTTLYISCPVTDRPGMKPSLPNKYWFCIKYTDHTDQAQDSVIVNKFWDDFRSSSIKHFKSNEIAPFLYLERLGNSRDLKAFTMAARQTPLLRKSADNAFFVPVSTPYEKRTGTTLLWLMTTLGIGSLLMLVIIMATPVNTERFSRFIASRHAASKQSTTATGGSGPAS